MKANDGYLVPKEHLEIIIKTCEVEGQYFNITLIERSKHSYYIEGTYKGIDRLYTAEVEFDYIKTEIRNNRINKILDND